MKPALSYHSTAVPRQWQQLPQGELMSKAIEQQLLILNPFAVGFRYPGEDIDKEELKEAIKALKILKPILLKRIKEFL